MGKLEESNKRKIGRRDLQQAILQTVALAGVLGVGFLAPNVLKSLDKLGFLSNRRQKSVLLPVN